MLAHELHRGVAAEVRGDDYVGDDAPRGSHERPLVIELTPPHSSPRSPLSPHSPQTEESMRRHNALAVRD